MKYYITPYGVDGGRVGEYELSPMPGCPRIAVSHGLRIYSQFQGMGYASRSHEERLNHARALGFSMVIATVVSTNKPQMHLMRKHHWKEVKEFFNLKTDHNVTLWAKQLDDPYAETSDGVGV